MREVNYSKSQKPLDKFVEDHFRKIFMFKFPVVNKSGKFFLKKIHRYRKPHEIPFNRDGFDLWHGSNWMMFDRLTWETLRKHNVYEHPSVKFYLKQAKKKLHNPCPQEIIVTSMIASYANGLKGETNNYRHIHWEGGKNWSPGTLTEKHFEDLKQSQALWARKLEAGESDKLLQMINSELLK